MDNLSFETLEKIGYKGFLLKDAPERVLQFGEGNFLRAFADHFIDVMNEKAGFHTKVVVVQPRGTGRWRDVINGQEGLYTLLLRGQDRGRKVDEARVISCLSRCLDPYREYEDFLALAKNPALRFIISNTTEAGIVYDPACSLQDAPAASFPGKLTQFLYARYRAGLPGFYILPAELTDRNGDALRDCIEKYARQWELPEGFGKWLAESNFFCSTLVDRIVPGYPKAEAESITERLGYKDALLDAAEVFASWVIEGPPSLLEEFPAEKADLPVILTENVDPYKRRKVRILNGAHTAMCAAAFLAGKDIVRDCMQDETIGEYLHRAVQKEICPVLTEFDKKELSEFADAVTERFLNPFIDHELLSIALNYTAKWKARVMPTVLEYREKTGQLPKILTFSFAAYLSFYHRGRILRDGALVGERDGKEYLIKDDAWVLETFLSKKDLKDGEFSKSTIEDERMWPPALKTLPGFTEAVACDLSLIRELGMKKAMEKILISEEELGYHKDTSR